MNKTPTPTKTQRLKKKLSQHREDLFWIGAAAAAVTMIVIASKKAPSVKLTGIATELPSYDLYQFSALTEHRPELLPKLKDLVVNYGVEDFLTFEI